MVLVMHRPDRLTVLRLAALADVDPRTAAKALALGAQAVKGRAGEKLASAMHELGVNRGTEPPPSFAA